MMDRVTGQPCTRVSYKSVPKRLAMNANLTCEDVKERSPKKAEEASPFGIRGIRTPDSGHAPHSRGVQESVKATEVCASG